MVTYYPLRVFEKGRPEMNDVATYTVPEMTCGHCKAVITREVSVVAGVHSVDVDLDTKLVTVTGEHLDDEALRAAIAEAGYEAA
jgi:copper chaperone CopZ